MLVDCHVHLDAFSNGEVSEVLERAQEASVGLVVCAGTTLASSRRSVELSSRFAGFFSGVGIHPMDLRGPVDPAIYGNLRQLATSTGKVLVVSEIGLDFMEGMPDRALQYQAFREQIRLARELSLPMIFHSRESHDEVLRVLKEEQAYEVGGIMHYFQADELTARKAMDLGFYISLARPLLRLPHLQQVASALPLDSIVLESDSAPQPFKGKRENWTEPRHVHQVAAKLAELRGTSLEEVARVTTANFRRLIGERWKVVEQFIGSGAAGL